MENFGPRLKTLRLKNNLTQRQMSLFLHIDRSSYASYESGRRLPDAHTLCKIADIFNISVDYLLNHTTTK